MGIKNIVKTTTNRGEFNRAYKQYLEVSKGKLHCSYCKYHCGENNDNKWYGGINDRNIRYPNWKLVSKNSKQWMRKPIRIIEDVCIGHKRTYIEIKFSI